MPIKMSRKQYAGIYGPTTGDRVRLADTELFISIEKDHTPYGEECLVGEGKNIRDGMMATSRVIRASAVDVIITNVVVMDPVLGIIKGNIGIKDGCIVGIGNAGNPDIKDNVDLIIDTNTGVIPEEGLIATPGGIDTHVHLVTPRLMWTALSSGITTVIGSGSGGIWDIGSNPTYNLHRMFEAFEDIPINIGFLGRGSSSQPAPLVHNIEAGVCGLKIHEDVGATPAVIDNCLSVAEVMDVAVCLHTDSLNEGCSLEETLAAIGSRTIHAYHVEGVGGGHVPNTLELIGQGKIICSSTNPTNPYTVNTEAEHLDMIMTVHRLNPMFPEDVDAAKSRVRGKTMAAEDILHDLGAISIMASDAQGMGRIGETIRRTWQTADKMKRYFRDVRLSDNERVLRYLAKYTINPAIAHGFSQYVGSLEPGKLADIVLWKPAFFGVKPEIILKCGFPVWAVVGDGNATIRGSQPTFYASQYGALGKAAGSLSLIFISQAALENKLERKFQSTRRFVAVRGTRIVGPADMIRNDYLPTVKVDPHTFDVFVDGKPVSCPPAEEVSLNRLYFFT